MNDNERMDLRALRADDTVQEVVVAGAMTRIRRESSAGPATLVLTDSARYLAPVLAAAAVVAFLLLGPSDRGGSRGELQGAGLLLEAAGNVPDPWLRWSLTDQQPDPRELLVMFAEAP